MPYYYLTPEGEREGPIERDDLVSLLSDGLIDEETKVSNGGQWMAASQFPELKAKEPVILHPALMTRPPRPQMPPKLRQSHIENKPQNPDGFGMWVFFAMLVWPVGLIGAIGFLCDPEKRSAGIALFMISMASALIGWFLFFR